VASAGCVRLGLVHERERRFHVHRRRDELKVTGVAREPQIADAAVPYQRFIVAKARSTPERMLAAQALMNLLPGLERIAGMLDLPGDPIDEAATLEGLAQSQAVIGLVGEIALLVALD
jgi:hypothetical protein